MDLDTLARDATQELLELPTPDHAARFTALKRTRTRRTVTRAVGVAAALGLAVGTWQLSGTDEQRPEPAPRPDEVTNGTLLAPRLHGTPRYTWTTVLGQPLEGLPEDLSRSLLQFTSDGSEVVYADGLGRLSARNLDTGVDRALVDCPGRCEGTLSPDGTLLAAGGARSIRLQTVGTDDVRFVDVDVAATGTPSWSPDGTELAFAGADGLYTVGVDGSDLRLVHRSTEPARLLADVAWSPDGSRIAFFDTQVLGRQAEFEDIQYTAMTIDPEGDSPTTLHDAGHCFCPAVPPPSVTWSPDSTLVAVAAARLGRWQGVYTVRPDGSEWQRVIEGQFGRPAWQPITR